MTPDSMLLKAPLLLGLIVLVPHVCSSDFVDINKRANYFALCVEFAVFHFNQVYPDEYAYKLLWIRRSQRKNTDCCPELILSMPRFWSPHELS
ncbi:probable cystatin-15 [Hyaena hyaena]|uniref:probable cystatin-15 n=1 Tax=Hyaena hyaena TaxID=95912 RepID=UPI0019243F9D|nr:probable cystatin-15 [Hyaena hyaena]